MLHNVLSGKEHNFMKRSSSEVDSHGYSYDYGSTMHYSTTAFSRNEPSSKKTYNCSDRLHHL